MHGVGSECMQRALAEAGFTDVHEVAEQAVPDPDFPTVAFPNPEEKGAIDLSLALARKVGADVVIANDPDADRCAVATVIGNDVVLVDGGCHLAGGDLPGEIDRARFGAQVEALGAVGEEAVEGGREHVLPGVLLHVVEAAAPVDDTANRRLGGDWFAGHVRNAPIVLIHDVDDRGAADRANIEWLPARRRVEEGSIEL